MNGWCAEGFEGVARAFEDNFTERGEHGAAVSVRWRGVEVVSLAGGYRDEHKASPWTTDTLVNMYSAGKGVLSTLLLRFVDRGEIDWETRLSSVWPEFAVGGKDTATIDHALSHRAGVPAIGPVLTNDDLRDWTTMTSALAATPAWSPPGARVIYHTNTFGHLIGELVRRLGGTRPGVHLQQLVTPLGIDVHFGVRPEDAHRCAEVLWRPAHPIPDIASFDGFDGDTLMNLKAHFNPPGYSSIGLVNSPEWRSLDIGSTSGHASARGLCDFYDALCTPDMLVSTPTLEAATRTLVHGDCPLLGEHVTFARGFQPTTPRRPLGPSRHSFGHFGTGGALGFADPDRHVSFGYVMNHVIPRWQSSRNRALIDALYASPPLQ